MSFFQRRIAPLGGGAVALSLLLTATSTGATNANPPFRGTRTTGVALQRAFAPSARGQSLSRHRFGMVTATTCSANSTTGFVGVTGQSNYAGGDESAVLGGSDNEACNSDSGVGAGTGNIVGNVNEQSLGQAESFIGGGFNNSISASESFVGAGLQNGVSGINSFVGSGAFNVSSGEYAFVGAGEDGLAQGQGSFVGAGGVVYDVAERNRGTPTFGIINQADGSDSFVGAGDLNTAGGDGSFVGGGGASSATIQSIVVNNQANATDSFIGAGDLNTIGSKATESVIVGGNNNDVTGVYGAIGGGSGNTATGAFADIPGGADNQAEGAASFAAGYHAEANHNGSFVWSDNVSGSSPLADTNIDQFVVRATGGTFIYSSENLASGVKLASGSGTWASLSDRNAKDGIVAIDDASILAKVAALPVTAWSYKTESGVRHVGPMAQDFYAAFGVGEDDRHITSIDEDGVALAAIKGLNEKLERKDAQNRSLQAKLAALEAREHRSEAQDVAFEHRIAALEALARK